MEGEHARLSTENENSLRFSTTGAAFFCFVVVVVVGTITRHYLCDIISLVGCLLRFSYEKPPSFIMASMGAASGQYKVDFA